MSTTLPRTKFTPPEVARMWGVSHDKVLTWIRSGELKAIDVATKRGGRPQYRIDAAELAAFEQRRIVVATPPLSRPRNHDHGDGVIEFF